MKRYLLKYSYLGSNFRGVQKQIALDDKFKPDPLSVQGVLEISLSRFKPKNYPNVCVSSRTDKGVHALETTAHVDLDLRKECDPVFLLHGMNRYFSKAKVDIRIKDVQEVPDTFHARYSAKSRTYLYRIAVLKKDFCHDIRNPYTASIPMGEWNRCCFIGNPEFDIDKLKEAVLLFPGLKDFRTFTGLLSRKPQNYSTIRRIHEFTISPGQPLINSHYDQSSSLYNFWDIIVKAKSFVYRQVRRMVGVLIAVALQRISVDEVKLMIEEPENNGWNCRASTAPAHALYLIKVEYDPMDLILPSSSVIGESEVVGAINSENSSLQDQVLTGSSYLQKLNNKSLSFKQGLKLCTMSFLESIASKRKALRHCKTIITTPLGESLLEDGESIQKIQSGLKLGAGYVVDDRPDLQMATVIPGLYLGSQDPAADEELLLAHGITHILSLGIRAFILPDGQCDETCGDDASNEVIPCRNGYLTVKFVPFLDTPESSLENALERCIPFIDEALSSGGRIFVHCNAGVSRSPSVVVAYILYRSRFRKPWASIPHSEGDGSGSMSLSDALQLVKSARPCIKPNPGFRKQLEEYEIKVRS